MSALLVSVALQNVADLELSAPRRAALQVPVKRVDVSAFLGTNIVSPIQPNE